MFKSAKRAPVNSIAIARLRMALLLAGDQGLTTGEMQDIANYATPSLAITKAVSGARIRLERARIARHGEMLTQHVYRVKSQSDALLLIQFFNHCADCYGYERITEAEAMAILELYPVDTEL